MTKAFVSASHSLADQPRQQSLTIRRDHPPRSDSDRQSSDGSPRPSYPTWTFLALGLIIGLVVILIAVLSGVGGRGAVVAESPAVGPIPDRYDAGRAMGYLNQLCDLGPRPSGSPAMVRQQQLLEDFFAKRGATVTRQGFETRNPNDGSALEMTNLIASWHPDRPKRFLFCAHYDTRPYPDRDPHNKRGVFIGANDGASGTAGLMELANQLDDLPSDIGVDLVMFDGEEFVWQERRDRYFIGSTYFANQYKTEPPKIGYQSGVLFDMIGDKELKLYYEVNSLRYAKDVARSFWKTADRLGVQAFVMRQRHELRDDHLPLNQIAGIPTIDVIDFDYPRPGIGAPSYWHTQQDVPANCSGESIAAVVWVAHQWMISQSSVSNQTNQ
ncbi:M28 family peptidase [Stieleria sp. TO1_6]|uniref:M28 family peptidase n=1 Tax=Stieleria tagensis TaxID=2956795 RepID=UPI00209B6A42|nr:M28 family peptidase [Stieleria tagensis]MCO8124087.1 M28 family peptidase [Stieleria tagensis]